MRALFGGTIAVVLLGIYVHLVSLGYGIVACATTPNCTKRAVGDFNDVMAQTLTVIGGLVSALVIAELAITKPGEAPVARVLSPNTPASAERILKIVTAIYILVWLVTGLAAFVKGMYQQKVLPPFTSVGQSWLGLAVAAAYAYFGLGPATPESNG